MATFLVNYTAENQYDEIVTEAFFEFLVMPCQDDQQKVFEEHIENSLDVSVFRSKNVFGFESVCFRTNHPFQALKFSASCRVVKPEGAPVFTNTLSLEEELKILRDESFVVDNYLFIQQSRFSTIPPEKIKEGFVYKEDIPLMEYLLKINRMVHESMDYLPGFTTPETTASEIIDHKQGVCQDYAHLMLGILRCNKIPCRYVSGYLNQGKNFIGSIQMHAWLEAHVPKAGWIGFDPTNNLLADLNYIKIAHGLDYDDCSPIKGSLKTSGSNQTTYTVQVVEQ